MNNRKGFWIKGISVFMAALAWFISVLIGDGPIAFAAGPPILDGLVDDVYLSDGYSIDYEGFYAQARATLYIIDDTSVDNSYIWLAWVVTKDFNDNSYGANKHSTWPKGHGFGDLLESDLQRLDLENSCGEMVLDATMDLLDGPPYHTAYSTPSGYDVNMDAAESVKTYINGGDWSDMSYDTALGANLNDHGYCHSQGDCDDGGTDLLVDSPPWQDEPNYVPVSAYSDWEYDLVWELRIERTVFETAGCPQGGILGIATNPVELHASPSKAGVSPVTLFRVTSAIGDYVWLDADRDGVQDVGEPGIANVTLALYSDPNGDGDPSDGTLVAETTTDLYGGYIFPDLGSGNYVVDVTDTNGVLSGYSLTAGSTDPHGPINLGRDEKYLDADFGYAPSDTSKAVIGDYLWSDADNDGIQDPGEPGIGGVTIQLLADYDGDENFTDVVTTTTTTADGSYLFQGLAPDDYVVDVTDTGNVLDGYTLSTGPQSSPDPTALIHVNAGDVYLNADFGYYKAGLGTIGNQIWLDEDGDGVYEPGDGEGGYSDVTVNLIEDTNGSGEWDAGERVIATTTAGDGTYLFTGLRLDDGDGDADYLVTVSHVNDPLRRYRKSTGPSPGTDNNSQDDPYAVALSAASPDNLTADFGYYFDQDGGLVGDFVWYDLDGDGVQDPGEAGVAGVELKLYKKKGSKWEEQGTVTTDANGNYHFPQLDIGGGGKYYRVEVLTSNFASGGALEGFTPTNQPDNMDESDKLTASDPVDWTLDFGYRFTSNSYSIGDYVWYDDDSDGQQDAGESGIQDVTLALYQDSDGDGVIDDGEPLLATDTTDADGNYSFDNLANGDYIVEVTDENNVLTGYLQTAGLDPWPVTISGSSRDDIDFGYVYDAGNGSIGDYVWDDADEDGEQDAGEEGIGDITVWLYEDEDGDGVIDPEDDLIATASTDSNGNYDFTGLASGNYIVDVDESDPDLPSGAVLTTDNDPLSVSLAPGEDYNDADFGFDPAPTAVTLSLLVARSESTVPAGQGPFSFWSWIGLVGLIVLAMDQIARSGQRE